jgi:two-component sensor histidine kinase
LPRIRYLPSPAAQKAELARVVAERTREKDELVWQIYHQLGNQIQIMQSAINIESRRVKSDEAVQVTERLAAIVAEMGKHYPDLLKRLDAAHVESTKWPVYVRGREQAERS